MDLKNVSYFSFLFFSFSLHHFWRYYIDLIAEHYIFTLKRTCATALQSLTERNTFESSLTGALKWLSEVTAFFKKKKRKKSASFLFVPSISCLHYLQFIKMFELFKFTSFQLISWIGSFCWRHEDPKITLAIATFVTVLCRIHALLTAD